MRDLSEQRRLAQAELAIDDANREDPNRAPSGEPLALAHGHLAVAWVLRLHPSAPEELLLAARAHHLRRFEVPRSSYPEGRAGYLKWRKDQKERHGADVMTLLRGVGYDERFCQRVASLVRRDDLNSDPEAQLVEDGACLAMIETQWDELAARLDRGKLVNVVEKTVKKMSPTAREHAVTLRPAIADLIDPA